MSKSAHIVRTKSVVPERSSIDVDVYFRESGATATPTTIHYRIDDLTTGTSILDWTSVAAASTTTLTIKSSENKIVASANAYERRQLTVSVDKGTDNETRDVAFWKVENIGGFDE